MKKMDIMLIVLFCSTVIAHLLIFLATVLPYWNFYTSPSSIMMIMAFFLAILVSICVIFSLICIMCHSSRWSKIGFVITFVMAFITGVLQIASFVVVVIVSQTGSEFDGISTIGICAYFALVSRADQKPTSQLGIHN
ncbi:MARVEL domain-containing protein [Caenorhabditis elegans]|uniref:MARVEL domain-containing protein n=1 Tax=Caenorhabditis elegans TaxID=6239 RepID=Q966E1_CAEEL|nr:MARVEL domain-containing protein [Caenorhabditis elegans]CCD72754.1 MARVEL domain-containing protein [Caenorhabditis elegans]|eukprot:NP_494705.1 Uncharacterized protein CELE_Y14H12A.1 [Caenorhabditis elegans]